MIFNEGFRREFFHLTELLQENVKLGRFLQVLKGALKGRSA